MALEYVGGKTAAITASTSTATNVSLTDLSGGLASAPAAGDIVIVGYATCSTIDRAIGVNTAGYAEIAELYANDTNDANLSVSWKIMGSTPDTTVAISATGSASDPGSVAIHVWRGVDATTPLDVTSTTATALNSWVPNPPSITPVTSGAVVLALGAGAGSSAPSAIGSITNSDLSNFIARSVDNAFRSVGIGVGSFAWTSGAFDPAAFTVAGTDSTLNSSASLTLALRPAAGGGAGGLTANGSGTIPISGTGTATVSSGTTLASSLSFLAGRADPANAASYTFTSVSLGDEAATRKIAVAVAWRSAGTTNDITGVTIAGVSATQVTGGRNTTGNNISATAIWIADVPTGATGSIVVTLASDAVRLGIAAYRLVGVETLRTSGTSLPTTGGVQTLSATVTLPSSGHTIAVTFNGAGQSWISAAHDDLASGERSFSVANASTNATWTGVTEDYDASLEATNSTYSALAYAVWDVVEASGAGSISASGSGTISISGTGTATARLTASGSGTVPLAGSGAAAVAAQASGSGALPLSGTGSAAVAVVASGSGTLDLSGTGAAELVSGLSASGSGTLEIIGSGAASVGIAAAGSGALSLIGTGAASVAIAGAGGGTIAVSGSGTGAVQSSAIGSGTLSLVGSGTGIIRVAAAGSGVLALAGSGAAAVAISAAGSGQIDISGSGSAGAQDNLTAAGSGTISLSGSGSATVGIAASGSGSIGLSGSGAGAVSWQRPPAASWRYRARVRAAWPFRRRAAARCPSAGPGKRASR
ncbi:MULTISPECIES: DUF2807 domain-containing protein [Sphingomonadales]|uniref:beta strand repeat-containing protein n=1 Tax=Sphingomonadales TaxID=204457 RepID=UPI0008254560|nr:MULTISPECIES: DUF2807 domain-containing protein [Sphingomonadales]